MNGPMLSGYNTASHSIATAIQRLRFQKGLQVRPFTSMIMAAIV